MSNDLYAAALKQLMELYNFTEEQSQAILQFAEDIISRSVSVTSDAIALQTVTINIEGFEKYMEKRKNDCPFCTIAEDAIRDLAEIKQKFINKYEQEKDSNE